MSDEQNKQWTNPNHWASGPPKSESESWNYERRNEVANWAEHIVAGMAAVRAAKPERWEESGGLTSIDTDEVVDLAIRLQSSVDAKCPKR